MSKQDIHGSPIGGTDDPAHASVGSLQETPVHPAPRRIAYALMALFVIAVLWAVFGKVDIVAVAPGRIVVSERTKTIQPLETSVVRQVRVKDGDRVQEGQVWAPAVTRLPRATTGAQSVAIRHAPAAH